MKRLTKCVSLFLCMILALQLGIPAYSADPAQEVSVYSVPVVGSEYSGSVSFYGMDGTYYLSFEDLAKLTRFDWEETDTHITLTQGLREVVVDKASGELVDCGMVDQGEIPITQYDGTFLCEGIPMLTYLGATCQLSQNRALEVLMPSVTIWEAIMPDYLDYYFNIAQLYGGEDQVKISLACDIIADVLDGISGHGLFADGDTHLEDALYEILDVDMMKYDSVQEFSAEQNQKINDFLSSEVFGTTLEAGDTAYDAMYQVLEDYAAFCIPAANDVLLDAMAQTDDPAYASELASQIQAQVYDQTAAKANLKTAGKIQSLLDVGMLALDTAVTSYSMMQYDDDTKHLFSRTITPEILQDAGYSNVDWSHVSDKISHTLQSNQSIVEHTAIDQVTQFALDKVTETGVTDALSLFTSKASIYTTAIQLGSFLSSLINYDRNQAFSADMNAIWLSVVQYDIAQLVSRLLVKERDESHFSDVDSLTRLKDMFTLYYRTIIAFSENISQSIEAFGGSNRDQWVQYFSGTSGDSVSNYTAQYLYKITNCTVAPIPAYSSLSDDLLTPQWLSQFPGAVSSGEWKEAYIDYINEHRDQPMADDFLYKLVDINGDAIPELYVNYGTTAAGDAICTYADGAVVEQTMWNYGFSYLEGQNRFRDAGGHMDVYYDKIYTIENGQFVLLCQGNYGASDNTNVSLDANGRPIYTYRWNGTEVASEAEYTDLLHQAYDTQQAITPFDGADFDSDAGRYVGNGLCNYEEILAAIRAN